MNQQLIHTAIKAVSQKLFDKEQQIKLAFACILANGHLLIEDKPGLGKTTLATAMAQVLGLHFRRIQFTSDMLPSDVLGVSIFQPNTADFKFFQGPIFTQLLLADELNRGTPRTQSALLEAMAEKQVSIDGKTYKLKQPFFVIATQNPTDEAGTFPLPDSQLDRFSVSISLGYPSTQAERQLYSDAFAQNLNTTLATIIELTQLLAMQQQVQIIHASDEVKDYLQLLIEKTRTNSLLVEGLSPRAGLAMYRLSQALAYIAGRDFVIPEDIQTAFLPTTSHRMRSRSTQQNIHNILAKILHETRIP
ncbi:FIG022979: MoxR-like ATPases [hydrothermal vent metagenome]|uniref:FIG022979: MoxR-like ATPases n=1 Tax=hydrothermal vent metagenome TaxID=652676 RepID=A0A3B0V9Q4_9ZZZZ